MLYLIEHDKETGAPKTRWSNGLMVLLRICLILSEHFASVYPIFQQYTYMTITAIMSSYPTFAIIIKYHIKRRNKTCLNQPSTNPPRSCLKRSAASTRLHTVTMTGRLYIYVASLSCRILSGIHSPAYYPTLTQKFPSRSHRMTQRRSIYAKRRYFNNENTLRRRCPSPIHFSKHLRHLRSPQHISTDLPYHAPHLRHNAPHQIPSEGRAPQ